MAHFLLLLLASTSAAVFHVPGDLCSLIQALQERKLRMNNSHKDKFREEIFTLLKKYQARSWTS